MEKQVKKYNLHMELEREGSVLKINDIVNAPFDLQDYIFTHDLEAYTIVKFDLKECED